MSNPQGYRGPSDNGSLFSFSVSGPGPAQTKLFQNPVPRLAVYELTQCY